MARRSTRYSATSDAPYRVYNIGNNNPVNLVDYIDEIEKCVGNDAIRNLLPLQAGDVPDTYANVENLMNDVGFKPDTSIQTGVANFVSWYRDYFQM